MAAERFDRRVEALFVAVLELPAEEQASFLDAHPDGAVAAEVRALLAVEESRLDDLFPQLPSEDALCMPGERAGDQIGHYVLREPIGTGGFGVVWRAEQQQPVRRDVALKVVKLGMDTHAVVARFEAERQALALMDHPHIAKVFDGGATEQGRPYFVMELIEGQAITTYCDKERLDVQARLELFVKVASAVQHAHQKGVIHRDIKPSNILVTETGDQPSPKVIDFGIAKATAAELTQRTLFTGIGQVLGTPEYMAPEQAAGAGGDIDTRTDVYSLGVLLYELLTGTRPFSFEVALERGHDEILRTIREQEPERPSTRVSTLGENSKAAAELRHVHPRRLGQLLRGDLDWIVLKAMEKDRSRRYESASEFATDVRRYLANLPVSAGPPGVTYRMQKFVLRNRVMVSFVGMAFLLLVIGIIGTTWGMYEADHARGLAEGEALRATAERARSRAVTDFLLNTLGLADPDITELSGMSMRDALDHAARDVGRAFAEYPESEAEVRQVLGLAYETLGRPDLAAVHLRRALELRQGELTVDESARAELLIALQGAMRATTTREWVRWGIEAHRACLLVVLRQQPKLHSDLVALDTLALNLAPIGKFAATFGRAIKQAEASISEKDRLWLPVTYCLTWSAIWMSWKRPDKVVADLCEQAIDLRFRIRPETRAGSRRLIKDVLDARVRAGDFAGAKRLATMRLDRLSSVLGADHWYLECYRSIIGQCLVDEGRFEEAEPMLQRSLQAFENSVAPNHPDTITTRSALARICDASGRHEQALAYRTVNREAALGWDGNISWIAVKQGMPKEHPLAVAVDEFDQIVTETREAGVSPMTRASDLTRVARRIVDERSATEDGDLASLILATQLTSRGDEVFRAGARVAGLLLLEDAGAVAREHKVVMPGMRCLILLNLAEALNKVGRYNEAEAAAADSLTIATTNRAAQAANGYQSMETTARRVLGTARRAVEAAQQAESHTGPPWKK